MDYNKIILVTILCVLLLAGVSLILFARRIDSCSTKAYLRIRRKAAEKLEVDDSLLSIYWRNPWKPAAGIWVPRVIGIFFVAIPLYLLFRLI
ncbi:hypothetical protein ACFLU1_03150, partial [Chloroflexota bacterium]